MKRESKNKSKKPKRVTFRVYWSKKTDCWWLTRGRQFVNDFIYKENAVFVGRQEAKETWSTGTYSRLLVYKKKGNKVQREYTYGRNSRKARS